MRERERGSKRNGDRPIKQCEKRVEKKGEIDKVKTGVVEER
jgi:hypothetical protein